MPAMPGRPLFFTLLTTVVAAGFLIGWIDTRPSWDDSGITVAAILAASFIPGILHPSRAWLWALIVGCEVAGFNLIPNGHAGGLMAVPVSFIGAYCGALLRKVIATGNPYSDK
jgi:hypothetical protein